MDKSTIILTGFMGTGKTAVGRALAQRLSRPFIDTDDLIASQAGLSVSQIFTTHGEAAFRTWENRVARDLSGRPGLVIATGGRLMLDPANAALLETEAAVFCLSASPDVIADRLSGDTIRPLLSGPDPKEQIRTLLQERAAGYGRFAVVDTSDKSVAQVVTAVCRQLGLAAIPTAPYQRKHIPYPDGSYPIHTGHHLLEEVAQLVPECGPLYVVSDAHVAPLYGHTLPSAEVVVFPAGEANKNLEMARFLYDELLSRGLDRSGTIVALGGGVVGDLAGFVAATYMRGVSLIQCPTTLLAMVDASIGGKTGVDLPAGKNLVGAFKQPMAVVADVTTLSTLPNGELSAGMAEVVKHAIIAGSAHLAWLEEQPWPIPPWEWFDLVSRSMAVKGAIVERDPFERGQRAWLNLGHTFAHAIERQSAYQVHHGQAVAMGLVAAANLSYRLGHAPQALQPRFESLLERCRLPSRIPSELSPEGLYEAMFSDKKKAAGKLRFVLLRDVGDVFVTGEVKREAVLATLEELSAR